MDVGRVLLLGFIAGATILLGLPVGRLRRPPAGLKQVLNAAAAGGAAVPVVECAVRCVRAAGGAGRGARRRVGGRVVGGAGQWAVVFGGLTAGLMSLIYYESWMTRRFARDDVPSRSAVSSAGPAGSGTSAGPGAMAAGELAGATGFASWSAARRLALLIPVGIGLHNFAEGVAQRHRGVRHHRAASGQADRPSRPFLLALGAIGGGPTFLGTLVGRSVTSEPVSLVFLTLAAGSILYVVLQLVGIGLKHRRVLLGWGLLPGLAAGFLTDLVIDAAGI